MIGSSNGALLHLCTALGIPWLPQTFLIPVQRSGIFWVKLFRLDIPLSAFLAKTLNPGATIFSMECDLRYLAVEVRKRHVFQTDTLGGMSSKEYLRGSPRFTEFLQQQDSDPEQQDGCSRARWQAARSGMGL